MCLVGNMQLKINILIACWTKYAAASANVLFADIYVYVHKQGSCNQGGGVGPSSNRDIADSTPLAPLAAKSILKQDTQPQIVGTLHSVLECVCVNVTSVVKQDWKSAIEKQVHVLCTHICK